jgi:maltooligosyltrehalose trehalohydrolase
MREAEPVREPHQSILQWYRGLIGLRAGTPELREGNFDRVAVHYHEEQRWLVMNRGPLSVVVNLGEQARVVAVNDSASRKLLMASDQRIGLTAEGVELPADSVAIIGPNNAPPSP